MEKHTPTPWTFNPKGSNIEEERKHSAGTIDETCPFAQHIATIWKDGELGEQAEANGEFIVRACNSFDDLLEALKDARDQIVALCSKDDVPDSVGIAIALAEGK